MKKKVLLVFKILISAALLYLIFKKIPFESVKETLLGVQWPFIAIAFLFFVSSKAIAAFRLQNYWRSISVQISHAYNLKLYLLGLFYNLFLPGGIGGDAYKGYAIKKHFKTPTKKLFGMLLLDRLSGLLLLVLLAVILALIPVHSFFIPYSWYLLGMLPLVIGVFYFGVKKIYPYTLTIFWAAFFKSAWVQSCQILAAYFILLSLGVTDSYGIYLLVFLLSSIVAVIPLTIGGVGSRELTFLYGAQWFGLAYETAIALSLLFFFITAVVSAFGMGYHFKKPQL
jgi:hypothetical protein